MDSSNNSTNSTNGTQNAKVDRAAACIVSVAVTAIFCGLILLLVLLPLSFVTLEYYEIGLKRSRTRGVVDTERVYGPGGRYFMSPDSVFQVYQADAHIYDRDALSVVTKDRLEVKLDVNIGYFIVPETLPNLQKEYNLRYHSAVESNAISAIKNMAVNFTTEDYFKRRQVVQTAMHNALHDIEGPLFVTFPYFYLSAMQISPSVASKQLQTAIQNEINAKQLFENKAADVRRQTDTKVNELNNNATKIMQNAIAQAAAAVKKAEAEAMMIVEEARILSAAKVFDALNLTTAKQRQQVDWYFGMVKRSDVKIRLGYQPQIVTTAA